VCVKVLEVHSLEGDIRDRPYLTHEDVLGLNFIRDHCPFIFRRHHRTGLRSHILQVLRPLEVAKERDGVIRDGVRWFPKAKPVKILRVFRAKFDGLPRAQEENRKVKIIEMFLGHPYYARSEEFLVHYRMKGLMDILLCGLQEVVEGEILDPWSTAEGDPLNPLLERLASPFHLQGLRIRPSVAKAHVREFINRVKKMILDVGHAPDLAGVGNLVLTREGVLKLVDINNVCAVQFDSTIRLDDRGYPVCDKSVEALYLIEKGIFGASRASSPIYAHFLHPERMRDVRQIEQRFHDNMKATADWQSGMMQEKDA
jgi:hypothetical protein